MTVDPVYQWMGFVIGLFLGVLSGVMIAVLRHRR